MWSSIFQHHTSLETGCMLPIVLNEEIKLIWYCFLIQCLNIFCVMVSVNKLIIKVNSENVFIFSIMKHVQSWTNQFKASICYFQVVLFVFAFSGTAALPGPMCIASAAFTKTSYSSLNTCPAITNWTSRNPSRAGQSLTECEGHICEIKYMIRTDHKMSS